MHGVFHVECHHKNQLRWSNTFNNTVTTVGKNALLDVNFAANVYTAASYVGLISAYGFASISANDTMTQKNWIEAGGGNAPMYEGPRKTAAWSAASNGTKTLSSPVTYVMTSDGLLKGAFLVFNAGASNAKDSFGGTLYSAGLFAGGDKTIYAEDTISVNYIVNI